MKILCVCFDGDLSAMFKALLVKRLTRLGVEGVEVQCAGTMCLAGQSASNEAIMCLRAEDIDLRDHRSRNVNGMDLDSFDLVLCTSPGQPANVRTFCTNKNTHIILVDPARGGIRDPVRGDSASHSTAVRILKRVIGDLIGRQIPLPTAAQATSAHTSPALEATA